MDGSGRKGKERGERGEREEERYPCQDSLPLGRCRLLGLVRTLLLLGFLVLGLVDGLVDCFVFWKV